MKQFCEILVDFLGTQAPTWQMSPIAIPYDLEHKGHGHQKLIQSQQYPKLPYQFLKIWYFSGYHAHKLEQTTQHCY